MVGWRNGHLDGFRIYDPLGALGIGDDVHSECAHDHVRESYDDCYYYPYGKDASCHSSILTLMLILS